MSQVNPLSGLIGQYDSDYSDEEAATPTATAVVPTAAAPLHTQIYQHTAAVTHPAPITHCAWSACYDESSGYTYYWNQYTNEVTWEAPQEYLLALRVASAQLTAGQNEVTAEEWQLYQQALAEKQAKASADAAAKAAAAPDTKPDGKPEENQKETKKDEKENLKKRPNSDSEEEKIELITEYQHDSESDSEPESPKKQIKPAKPAVRRPPRLKKKVPKILGKPPNKPPEKVIPKVKEPSPVPQVKKLPNPFRTATKKQKTKHLEYGPTLPENQEYTMPIGPELPTSLDSDKLNDESKSNENESKDTDSVKNDEESKSSKTDDESQDESILMKKIVDKAKILENLGGELPNDVIKLIETEKKPSESNSPNKSNENSRESQSNTMDTNVDDLLEEIEKKELPKITKKKELKVEKIDMFSDDANFPTEPNSLTNSPKAFKPIQASPKEERSYTPELDAIVQNKLLEKGIAVEKIEDKAVEVKPLFPSSTPIEKESTPCLFPSASKIEEIPKETPKVIEKVLVEPVPKTVEVAKDVEEKKGPNLYITPANEIENVPKKKIRISTSLLPEPKKAEVPSYTTKYSQYIDGFSGERTGLGFSKIEEVEEPQKPVHGGFVKQTVMFTKGETLNEEKPKELTEKEVLDALSDVLSSKLKFLNQQAALISPVQEMTIQMQSLAAAFSVGALSLAYWRGWLQAADSSLTRLEVSAAPPGWICEFDREEEKYRYRREADGLVQWEYPTVEQDDMDISTTPPPPPCEPQDSTAKLTTQSPKAKTPKEIPKAVKTLKESPKPPKELPKPPPPPPPEPPKTPPLPPPPPEVWKPAESIQEPVEVWTKPVETASWQKTDDAWKAWQKQQETWQTTQTWQATHETWTAAQQQAWQASQQHWPAAAWTHTAQHSTPAVAVTSAETWQKSTETWQAPPPPPPPTWSDPPPPPPPPTWADSTTPPPPGCEDTELFPTPLQPEPSRKESLGDELMSFYNDLAELEKETTSTKEQEIPAIVETSKVAEVMSPEHPIVTKIEAEDTNGVKIDGKVKKKSKVKISASVGLKHKSVSNLVAKWQQVADEIGSD